MKHPLFTRIFRILSIAVLLTSTLCAQPESWYISRIAGVLGGQTEVPVENGRVDIVNDTYAIEVERAANWKHAIGQSLWYGIQTNRKPGIVLIMSSLDDRRHGIRLQSTLDHSGIGEKIRVWFYPEEFGKTFDEIQREFKQERSSDPSATGYWLTTSSNVRHNSRCQWYTHSKGRYSSATEGRACRTCGG